MQTRPPLPPFTLETARQKVQAAETHGTPAIPSAFASAYTEDSQWRNRDEFLQGREAIVEFLRRKWLRELEYRLRKELWAFTGPIASRCASSTSATTMTVSGGAVTAMSTGSSTRVV